MAQRINTPNKDVDEFGAGKHGFQDEILGVQSATEFSAIWCNHVQEEIANVVEGFGGALNPALRNQMYSAVFAAIAAAIAAAAVPDASTTVKGKSELATSAEMQAGTDPARVPPVSAVAAAIMGIGQTYQDMTASRAPATTYTNSTGKPILLSVLVQMAGNTLFTLTVGGVIVATSRASTSDTDYDTLTAIVPNGQTYSASGFTTFMEMR